MNNFFRQKRIIFFFACCGIALIALFVVYGKLAVQPVAPVSQNKPTVERGSIVDRSGFPLAVQTNFYHIGVSIKNIRDNEKLKLQFAKDIAPLLDMEEGDVIKLLNSSRSFVYLKKKVEQTYYESIKKKNLKIKIEKDLLELKYIEKNKKNTDNRYTLPIYIDEKQLEKIGIENYQDYLINWISIGYLKMLIKIHDFLINYYNLTLEKGLKIDDVMLVLIDILDTEIKDFPKGLKKSIEVGKETSGKCFFINKIIQPVSLTPELTLLLQGKDAYNIVPRI